MKERDEEIEAGKIYIVKVEVFGEGVDMWLKGQRDNKNHKQKDNIVGRRKL